MTWSPGRSVSRWTPWLPNCAPAPHSTAHVIVIPFRVLGLQLQKRMGIAVQELQHVRLDRHLLILKVGGRKRVMCVSPNAQNAYSCEDENE